MAGFPLEILKEILPFLEQLVIFGVLFELQIAIENFLDVILTCYGYEK